MPDLSSKLNQTMQPQSESATSEADPEETKKKLAGTLGTVASGSPTVDHINSLSQQLAALKMNLPDKADTSKIDALEEKAYDMQDRRASRDEWLQFANTMGNALAKIGMGVVGQNTKTDLSGVQLPGEKLDFLADADRGEASLGHQLQLSNQARGTVLSENREDRNRAKEEYQTQYSSLAEQMRGAQTQLKEEGKDLRAEASRDLKEKIEEAKRAADKADSKAERDIQNKRLDLYSQQLDLLQQKINKSPDKSGPLPTKPDPAVAAKTKSDAKQAQLDANKLDNIHSLFSALSAAAQANEGVLKESDNLKKDSGLTALLKKSNTNLGAAVAAFNQDVIDPSKKETAFVSALRPTKTTPQTTPQTMSTAPATLQESTPVPKLVNQAAPLQPATASPVTMISVIAPDGTPGKIPQDKLAEKLKMGYTLPGKK